MRIYTHTLAMQNPTTLKFPKEALLARRQFATPMLLVNLKPHLNPSALIDQEQRSNFQAALFKIVFERVFPPLDVPSSGPECARVARKTNSPCSAHQAASPEAHHTNRSAWHACTTLQKASVAVSHQRTISRQQDWASERVARWRKIKSSVRDWNLVHQGQQCDHEKSP